MSGRVCPRDAARWLPARNGMPAGVASGERLDHEGAKTAKGLDHEDAKTAKDAKHEASRRGASLRDLRASWSSLTFATSWSKRFIFRSIRLIRRHMRVGCFSELML